MSYDEYLDDFNVRALPLASGPGHSPYPFSMAAAVVSLSAARLQPAAALVRRLKEP